MIDRLIQGQQHLDSVDPKEFISKFSFVMKIDINQAIKLVDIIVATKARSLLIQVLFN